jgi:uncharacterized membrane protein
MAKITLVFAVLLILLGLGSYFGTGSQYPTSLIPTWFGLALGVFGYLAMSPQESRRKLFMHINVTIGLLGFIGAAWRAISSYLAAHSAGTEPNHIALACQGAMAGLLLVYVLMCVKSFIDARRSGKV